MISVGKFLRDKRGSVAVPLTIAVIPFLMIAGGAIDYAGAFNLRTSLQSAVDSAALSAAGTVSDKESDKIATVVKHLKSNTKFAYSTPDVIAGTNSVTVSVSATYPSSFLKLVGIDSLPVNVTATAVIVKKPICLLALNPVSNDALKIWGSSAKVTANNCAVHSNSQSASGMTSTSGAISTAETFCSTGGYSGTQFNPLPKSKCRAVKDPYAGLPVPNVSGCDFTGKTISGGTENLIPGVYCGGLDIGGGDVHLAPGVYVMKDGEFKVSGSANVVGDGVTIYLYGDNSELAVTGGGVVELSAPATGPYSGMVFVQNPDFASGGSSKFNGHSGTKIVGTGYFPNQTLSVGGNGDFGANSPYMVFVADTLEYHGNGKLTMNFDAAAAGFNSTAPGEYWGTRLAN